MTQYTSNPQQDYKTLINLPKSTAKLFLETTQAKRFMSKVNFRLTKTSVQSSPPTPQTYTHNPPYSHHTDPQHQTHSATTTPSSY